MLINDAKLKCRRRNGCNPFDPSSDNNRDILWASNRGYIDVMKLLFNYLGSEKINLGVIMQYLKELRSELSYDMIYDNIEKLAMKSLKELIQIGNQNFEDREIIMTKSALAGSAKAGNKLQFIALVASP